MGGGRPAEAGGGIMEKIIATEPIKQYIADGLNSGKFGHDAVEILAEIEYSPAADALDWEIIERLMRAFPRSFINQSGEFIAHRDSNQYFILRSCKNELDIKCKVLEWFSRGAYKTAPYKSDNKNKSLHAFMLNGINKFLGTRFTEDDMEYIYTYLGNAIHHQKTIEFITKANYNMSFFRQFEEK